MIEMGLGDALARPDQPTAAEDEVVHAWGFCGGWNPTSLLMYAALYPVADFDMLLEGLVAIRNTVDKRN